MISLKLPSFAAKAPRARRGVRLLPTLMTTLAALAGLKAVALAQGAAQEAALPASNTAAAPATPGAAAPANAQAASTPAEGAAQCAPTAGFAEQAGLSQAEVQVLQALGARRQALDARAGQIDTEAQMMSAAERRLDERLAELRRLESTVSTMLGQLDEQQATRVANLVDVYQRMRAKDAAAVFDTLDENTLVMVAGRMRQANLAEVMGRMQPDRARRLTQLLAVVSPAARDAQTLLAAASVPGPQAAPAAAR